MSVGRPGDRTGWTRRAAGRALVGLAGTALAGLPARAATGPFDDWLKGLRADARNEGIRAPTLDAALQGVSPIARVLELDRKQPETTLTFDQYIERVVPQSRVDRARERYTQRRPLLDEVSQRYGVPGRFIVALWGIESDFGQQTGGFSVVAALATLAYDGRRAAFFRRELLDALKILDRGDITPAAMKGSWAGAMGQSQFMPSSFLRYAVDFNGDGRRDIWSDGPDLFASIANYLQSVGWHAGETWGRAVVVPPGFDARQAGLERLRPMVEWAALGVRRADGLPIDSNDPPAALLFPGGDTGPGYLVHDNFRVILRWNRSNYFATAVGLLADRIE